MSQDFVLSVSSLCKTFGPSSKPFTAVANISFGLKKGEILGLLGPNGAGKTTTMQMLLGVLTPTKGTIAYFGKDFNTHQEEILEKVNFSTTYTHLPWRLRVWETLKYNAYLYKINNRQKRIDKIVEVFRLKDLLHEEISALSAGQATRLNLAKAFLNFPEILLLDEPTASLDPETASYIRSFILEERKEFNVSIVFTSHNMAEVEEICDRVIFIKNGKIIAEDKPENLPKLIKFSTLELVMIDGLKRTAEICRELKLVHTIAKRAIQIRIEEHAIASFLNRLAGKGITYDQISINKPNLEDYFMEVVAKKL